MELDDLIKKEVLKKFYEKEHELLEDIKVYQAKPGENTIRHSFETDYCIAIARYDIEQEKFIRIECNVFKGLDEQGKDVFDYYLIDL